MSIFFIVGADISDNTANFMYDRSSQNPHRMALYMIASKMARIVNGDFNSIDGWHDIGGYSKLIEDLL